MNTLLRVLIPCLALQIAHADEGMWQPHQLPQLSQQLTRLGLKVAPENLNDLTAHPMNAIVGLGFCSASFVSPEGLVVTNHHCVQGILQHNSTPARNLIEDGFLAENNAEDLPGGPGNRVLVTVQASSVTETMLDGLTPDMDGLDRHNALETREKKLIAECENVDGYRCGVHSFHDGLEFYLIRQLEIRDVRLVYAPPRSIGEFGGDIDNWMWPRHTGDFSFLRAYVSADGKPADYDEDNVPYSPEHFLTVSTNGLSDGDFTMAVGYPGRTYRHRLASEANDVGSWYYPTRKRLFEDALTIIERETADRADAAIKYSSLVQGLNNVIKNYDGMIEGFRTSGLVGRKNMAEQQLAAWLQDKAGEKQANSLDELNALIGEYRDGRAQRLVYRDFLRRRAALLGAAARLYRLSKEKQKPDAEREKGFQERDWLRIEESLAKIEKSFDKQVDRALLEHYLEQYAALPGDQRIAALDRWFEIDDDGIDNETVARKLDELYTNTSLDDTDTRLALLDASPEDFESSDDPFIELAVALYESDIAQESEEKRYLGRFQYARSQYMSALSSWLADQGRPLYADANGTLRVTFGQVSGYRPRDAVAYEPFTTIAGILQKHTGRKPFDAPAALLAAIDQERFGAHADKQLKSVPVNFLATLDATGGNSGSAVLDANGELVGLLFDGNYEAINSDWYLNPAITRSICVDIRYVLWIMEAVDGAHRLLREMGISPASLHALNPQPGVN